MTLTSRRVEKLVENQYLGLPPSFDDSDVYNILMDIGHQAQYDTPVHEILDIMSNPDYFYYTCKWLLNINLMPFQCLILKELWTRKFPMIIATRGGGKSFLLALYALLRCIFTPESKVVIVGAAFRQSKLIFEYMHTFWRNSQILRHMCGHGKQEGPKFDTDRCTFYIGDSVAYAIPMGDGCLHSMTLLTKKDKFDYIVNPTSEVWGNGKFRLSDENYDNGVKPTKVVRTKKGFEFEGTHNHKMMVVRNQQIEWVRADEMVVGDRILIDRSYRWHDGSFECGVDEAYTLGLMIGDGCWTQPGRLSFATNDQELYDALAAYSNLPFKPTADPQHYNCCGKQYIQQLLDRWQLKERCYTKDKALPPTILSAPRPQMTACLQGLFDTDGTLQVSNAKGGTAIAVSFCNTSAELVRQIQYILLHYGIVAQVSSRQRENDDWNRVYELRMSGQNAIKFAHEIGFRLPRKQKILEAAVRAKLRTTVVDDTIPDVRLDMMRIAREYAQTHRGSPDVASCKIGERKAITFEYASRFLERFGDVDDPFIERLRALLDDDIYYDEIVSIKEGECHTYDIHVPDGHEYCANGFFSHNSKIRGLRANYTLADEFSAINQEIFEVVIKGFSAVSASPTERAKDFARIQVLKSLGMHAEADDIDIGFGNQLVISGTAYYSFNHFYDYWKRYRSIVKSKGDPKKLEEIFQGEVPPEFDWTQFSVFRIPWTKIPRGFMDETQINQARATVHRAIYNMEYNATFSEDSEGFFNRRLIESCVCHKPISLSSGDVQFSAMTRGNPNCRYVYGIDPASEQDNFAIVILEVHPDHRRIVYAWTMTRQRLRERMKNQGAVTQKSFYAYCARKVRDLMKVFPTDHIGIDGQGGGIAIVEALHDESEFDAMRGEKPLWPWVRRGENDVFWWEKDNKPTDREPGDHCLHVVQFANADFMREANHGMKRDFETLTTLFPFFDSATISEAISMDKIQGRDYDTLEDCVMDIEELKDELATIIHDQTNAGRDRWDTPEVKLPGNKKGRLRKDRYSALLIANMIARVIDNELPGVQHKFVGGFVGQRKGTRTRTGQLYVGPDHMIQKMNAAPGRGVRRGV